MMRTLRFFITALYTFLFWFVFPEPIAFLIGFPVVVFEYEPTVGVLLVFGAFVVPALLFAWSIGGER